MTIAEPMTLLTDYALAGVTGWLGWRVLAARRGQASRTWWAAAFVSLTFAAMLGGTYHGFAPHLAERSVFVLWKATVLAVGVASFAMLAGSTLAMTTGRTRKLLLAFAGAKLVLYAAWMLKHDAFIYVVADSAVSMATLAFLHGAAALRRSDPASRWVVAGVGISVLAAGVQASGFALHRHFNHNDLYHVIQMGALFLFYSGGMRMRDRFEHTRLPLP